MYFLERRVTVLCLLRFVASFFLISVSTVAEQTSKQWTFNSGPQKTQLIELYTSEGCSSCPPADRWLSKLKTDPDLWKRYIPVAFHVDYWDHLGWKDPFADSRHTQRQRHYHQNGSSGSVYTPQFIVNGDEWRGYFLRPQAGNLPVPDAKFQGRLMIKVVEDNKLLNIETLFKSQQPLQPIRQQRLHVALVGADIQTVVKHGENAGRTLKHNFVVLKHKIYSMTGTPKTLTAKGSFNLQEDLPIALTSVALIGVAVWISDKNDHVVQATGGWIDLKVSETM